jgi:hypothetical protein
MFANPPPLSVGVFHVEQPVKCFYRCGSGPVMSTTARHRHARTPTKLLGSGNRPGRPRGSAPPCKCDGVIPTGLWGQSRRLGNARRHPAAAYPNTCRTCPGPIHRSDGSPKPCARDAVMSRRVVSPASRPRSNWRCFTWNFAGCCRDTHIAPTPVPTTRRRQRRSSTPRYSRTDGRWLGVALVSRRCRLRAPPILKGPRRREFDSNQYECRDLPGADRRLELATVFHVEQRAKRCGASELMRGRRLRGSAAALEVESTPLAVLPGQCRSSGRAKTLGTACPLGVPYVVGLARGALTLPTRSGLKSAVRGPHVARADAVIANSLREDRVAKRY